MGGEYRAALLGFARGALGARVAEQPLGSRRGPQVDAYLAGCVRRGKPVAQVGAPWAAAFASWCAYSAWAHVNLGADPRPVALAWPGAPGTVVAPPHGYRATAAELYEDAVSAGAWRGAGSGYAPAPGDLCVVARGGIGPREGGGHVAVVDAPLDAGAGRWWCIGGDEQHAVRRSPRSLSDVVEPVVGWIAPGDGVG